MRDTPDMREMSVSEQRYLAALAVIRDGDTVTEVAARFGVSRKTLHVWLSRYEAGGLEDLGDRSHRPRSCPHQMPPAVEVDASLRVHGLVWHRWDHCRFHQVPHRVETRLGHRCGLHRGGLDGTDIEALVAFTHGVLSSLRRSRPCASWGAQRRQPVRSTSLRAVPVPTGTCPTATAHERPAKGRLAPGTVRSDRREPDTRGSTVACGCRFRTAARGSTSKASPAS
jgi:Helix-turn-helix domain